MNKINLNRKSKWIKIKMNHCDSFASEVNQNESESKNKMIRQSESKITKRF